MSVLLEGAFDGELDKFFVYVNMTIKTKQPANSEILCLQNCSWLDIIE
ncbi:hypothetical protein [Pectinatus haikarae]|nr:hypothetical protein [Pectinatus haikarae]